MFGRKLRVLAALFGSLLLLVTMVASADASSSGTASLHDGAGGSCTGQNVGAGRGNLTYVLRGSTLTLTVNLQGAAANRTYDVFHRCVKGIGTITTDGGGNASKTFVVSGWNPNGSSIDLNFTGTSGQGHIGGATMAYVIDGVAPVLSNVPGNQTREATSPQGAAVSWGSPTAQDNLDGSLPVSCSPGSGSTFGLGTTQVTCSAADDAGNVGSASFFVTVQDTIAPSVNAFAAPAANGNGWNNGNVTVTVNASDSGSGVKEIVYSLAGAQTGGATLAGATAAVSITTHGSTTVSYFARDNAGRVSATQQLTLHLDKGNPTISSSQSPPANVDGWNNQGVTVSFACADGLSDIASCTGPVNVTTQGASQSVTGTAVDKAGNSASTVATVNVDLTAPTTTGSRSPAANANGWNKADVTASFLCGDSLSGVKSCPGPVVVSTNGAGQSVTGTATDKAGNSASATVSNISVDKIAPTISGAVVAGAAGTGGWYRGDVAIGWTCADQAGLSGISGSCPANSVIGGEGSALSASASVSDRAGNSTGATATVKIDRTAPLTSASAPNGWNDGSVLVSFSASDNLSGVSATYFAVNGGALQSGSSLTLTAEGIHNVTYFSVDNAGNVEGVANSLFVNARFGWVDTGIDLPAGGGTTVGASGLGNFGCGTCQTGPDGIPGGTPGNFLAPAAPRFSLVGRIGPSGTPFFVGANATLTPPSGGRLYLGYNDDFFGDNGGGYDVKISTPRSLQVKIDLTAPNINHSQSPAANLAGWNSTAVTVTFTCSDQPHLSGLAFCSPPATVATEGQEQGVQGLARDVAGNEAQATRFVNVDASAPTIAASRAPASNSFGWNKIDVTVDFACNDQLGLSGIAFCSPSSTKGEGAGQSATGTAIDAAGNSSSTTLSDINVDKSLPTVIGSRTEANGFGWHNGPVAVAFACDDQASLSGVDTCVGATTLAGEGAGQSVTGTATDRAGNSASATVADVNVDLTNPTIVPSRLPLANQHGWSNADVAVSFACDDALSGIDTCVGATTLTHETAGSAVTGTTTDKAGNSASATEANVKIDKSSPIIQIGVAAEGGSYVNTVSPTVDVSDALSGVDAALTVVMVNGQPYVGGTPLTAAGTYVLSVSIVDKAGNAASRTITFRVQHSTALTITGATSGDWNDPATLEATLVDTGVTPAAPIGGQAVAIQLGSVSCAATTDASGKASCTVVPNQVPASYPQVATYAGSALYLASSVAGSFETLKEATSLAITSHNALPTAGVVVTARLTEDGGTLPVAGRSVTFGAGNATATGTTNADGVATATLMLPPGQYTLSAGFGGDAHYVGSNAGAQTLFVYAPSQFVIWGGNPGGVQAGQRYYFWGSQWHKQVQSGAYDAGGSFKGYAAQVDGASWSTGPGNASNPPASVASYVGVIVSTDVDKSGSTITGNVTRVVVLRVDNASGYQPSPGHEATGVMVGTAP